MQIDKCCLQCGETLPDYAPTNKQYCTDACKQRAYRDRLEEPRDEPPAMVAEEEGGLHPLAWLGVLGLGVLLFGSTGQTGNKPVTTRSVPPVPPKSNTL